MRGSRWTRLCIAISLMMSVTQIAKAQTAQPDYWVVGVTNANDETHRPTSLWVIDTSRITSSGPHVRRAWLWLYLSPQNPEPTAGNHVLSFVEYDCGGRRYRLLQSTMYASDGDVKQNHIFPETEEWAFVAPQSVSEAQLDFVCGDAVFRAHSGAAPMATLTPDIVAGIVFSGHQSN